MSQKTSNAHLVLLSVLLGMLVSLPVFAGSAVIGSVAGNTNATLSGQAILPNTTIYSGDSLQVKDGVAIVAMNNGGRITLGRDTTVSFLRNSGETTVLMDGGNAMFYHPAESEAVQIKAGDVSISAASGFLTEGEVAMADGSVVVTSREGTLRVKANGRETEVGKGKTMKLSAKSAKTARSPQGGGAVIGGASALTVATLGAAATGAVLGGVAMSRAGGARDAANSALSSANAATGAANAAGSAAAAAANNANSVGCALNNLNKSIHPGSASPYTPGSGFSCP